MDFILRCAGAVSAFATYRPAGVGALRFIPPEALGIAHYGLPEIATLGDDALTVRAGEIAAELEALDAVPEWTEEGGQRATFDTLNAELTAIEARQAHLRERATIRSRAAAAANVEPVDVPTTRIAKSADDAFDLRTLSFGASDGEVRARAITAIEKAPEVPDAVRQQATKVVERTPAEVARRVLLTGSQAYRTAYQKGMVGQAMLWDPAERDAFRAALSLTDANGGFAIPFLLDPTIISTKDVSTNPFRRIGHVATGTSDVWQGISSGGLTASFDAEGAEVSDDSPTLAQPAITAHMARAFVRGSIEIAMDWAAIEADLRVMFQEGKDDLEASVMAIGTGSG
ncbi:MAG: phage major capsid protein, partial [Chloroflexi bacterium]|nr:phage major capsid protein [Chloroflexota bacterium]